MSSNLIFYLQGVHSLSSACTDWALKSKLRIVSSEDFRWLDASKSCHEAKAHSKLQWQEVQTKTLVGGDALGYGVGHLTFSFSHSSLETPLLFIIHLCRMSISVHYCTLTTHFVQWKQYISCHMTMYMPLHLELSVALDKALPFSTSRTSCWFLFIRVGLFGCTHLFRSWKSSQGLKAKDRMLLLWVRGRQIFSGTTGMYVYYVYLKQG